MSAYLQIGRHIQTETFKYLSALELPMVNQYARRRAKDPRRARRMVDVLRAEGKCEFDVYDMVRVQHELPDFPSTKRTHRHDLSTTEMSAQLTHNQKELGIEPSGFHKVQVSRLSGAKSVKLWRIKDCPLPVETNPWAAATN